ncbi:mitotic checkpoint regulator, MAD2B-interacting-domain-containing protein [Xylariaceae sp. FL0662B]|nr:mitotic checkpoint regulator, MAD2B-interacting-domain-containing protein [Xylariaceae sp. FL0662B]
MGLVDYSDSESDSEPVAQPAAPAPQTAGGKKPFQKVVDRSKPGKILVNLPSSGRDDTKDTNSDEPPAKRARTAGGRGGAFSGFNSFLPPPKNVGKSTAASSSSGKGAPRAGINLKTGAAPGFSRETDGAAEEGADTTSKGEGGMDLPAPKLQQLSIPEGQKPAEEVKLVGKPLMFKPLSVSRKPTKKNVVKSTTVSKTTATDAPAPAPPVPPANQVSQREEEEAPPAKKKKVSLFSISDEPCDEPADTPSSSGVYEPMFSSTTDTSVPNSTAEAFAAYDAQFASSAPAFAPAPTPSESSTTLDAIASDMNLSAAARRELFGRSGAPQGSASQARVLNFDTGREYAHNEALRAAGEQQAFNPVRAIAPGKHSLRQLVSQVHNQREALEDSFAKGKSNRSEAGARYGWR